MSPLMSRLMSEHTPAVNRQVMEGLAVTYMAKAEEYMDKVLRSASKSFPQGLEYVGYERCTPEEEYSEITKDKGNKRVFNLARSDLYLVKYKFTFKGEAVQGRYIYLPFCGEAGMISLGGAMFHITPVLSDKVISPGFESIFVRLLRDKIIFKRWYHAVMVDGKRETTHFVWSKIYRKAEDNKKVPATTNALTSVAHYLFAKYGFTKTFQKYAGFVPVVGEGEITPENYPPSDWVICESSQLASQTKPKTFIGNFYEPSKLQLAIPRNMWNNATKSLVVGFFYVVDHFPTRFRPGYLDSQSLWMILLGHIIFSGLYGENQLYTNIQEHFVSLDDYVDTIVIEKLKENDYHVENFYDLLALILINFKTLSFSTENSALSMYGKSLDVLYYMLYELTKDIFTVNFLLSKQSNRRPLQMKDVVETFNKHMKMGSIFKLTSGKIILESVSYSGDHKYPKITAKVVEQESKPGATRGKSKRVVVGEDKYIDISMVEAGSILFLSKSNPTPTNHINPFVCLDLATGTILPNPKFKDIREKTQNLFK